MEYIIMFITHIHKTAAYFVASDFPKIELEQFPDAVEAFIGQLSKIAEIYFSML